ncbi:hypothetical protein JJC04_10295 [Flavobacterium covae]|nr:hypothetical protein [Flavobacterium covae]QYS90482.1 hypothetical protein JJC04_10295 [Flavobacterium covae]
MISYELRVAKVGFCGQTMLFFYNFEKNDAMDDKKKNKLEEPAEVYGGISEKLSISNDERLILEALLSKSKSNHASNKTFSTVEAMKIYREKLNTNR